MQPPSEPKPPEKPKKLPGFTKNQRNETMRAISLITQIAITIMITIALGVFIGRSLDNWLGTSPWLLLLFTFFGMGAAFKFIYDLSNRF